MAFNRTQRWPLRQLLRWAEWYANRHTHRIVTVADAMIRQSVAARVAHAAQMQTVYSGMDVTRFDPVRYDRQAVRAELSLDPDAVVVATIARLFQNKGYEALIPIMAEAAARAPRLHFLWIGDGPARPEYERALAQRGLRDRTTLVGLVPPTEIPRLLAGCDLLAHPSRWEGLPRAVVQALLMQAPAVAYDIDGTPEVVRDGETGRLVPYGDADAFINALVTLAEDAESRRRMGRTGRVACLERFDWRAMVASLDELYQALPAGR
jgi:glycosyltransferase involved in cell wall biosynthesis